MFPFSDDDDGGWRQSPDIFVLRKKLKDFLDALASLDFKLSVSE